MPVSPSIDSFFVLGDDIPQPEFKAWAQSVEAQVSRAIAGHKALSSLDGREGFWLDYISDSAAILDYSGAKSALGRVTDFTTYSRSTVATYTGPDGLVKTAAINELRRDYDPTTRAPKGVLLEPAATNLLLRSQEFGNGSWSPFNVSVAENTTAAPDGTNTADTLSTTGANGQIAQVVTLTAGVTYSYSKWIKKSGSNNWALLTLYSGSGDITGWVNLATGAAGSTSGSWTNKTVTAKAYRDGWVRLTLKGTANATASYGVITKTCAADLSGPASGESVHLWGAQLQVGDGDSYIPTGATTASRAADSHSAATSAIPFDPAQGTLVAEFETIANPVGYPAVIALSDGTNDNNIEILRYLGTPAIGQAMRTGGAIQVDQIVGNNTHGAVAKAAMAYRTNDVRMSLNGATAVSDPSASIPTVNVLTFGVRFGAVLQPLWLRRAGYLSRPLTSPELQIQAT